MRSPFRLLFAAVLVALLVAACTTTPTSPEDRATGEAVEDPGTTTDAQPSPLPSASASDAPDEPGEASEEPTTPDETPGEGGEPSPEQTASEPDGGALTALADGGVVGSNGPAYLRGDRPRVVLEVDAQDGANLSDGVVGHVRSVLDRESNSSVEVLRGSATSTQRETWTVAQLREAAAASRSVAHDDSTAVLHVLALRGRFAENDGVIGLAFDSSTAVVFPDQWSDLTTLLLSGDAIARAVTTHEVGHLLGLVGLVEEPVSDHEDDEHPGHTTDENDVMYFAIETTLIAGLSGVPDDFGPLTRADLAALRDG